MLVEEPIQITEPDYRGILQLYFCKNIFNPIGSIKTVNDNDLSEKRVEIVLNGLFILVKDQNENILQEYINLNDINFKWKLWFCIFTFNINYDQSKTLM